MNKQRLYLDTSVFGGYYDEEFQEFTKPLFDRLYKGEFKILLSAVLQKELEPAPEKNKTTHSRIKRRIHRIFKRR